MQSFSLVNKCFASPCWHSQEPTWRLRFVMRFGEQALTASLPAEQTNAEEGAFPAKHPEGRCLASAGGGGGGKTFPQTLSRVCWQNSTLGCVLDSFS